MVEDLVLSDETEGHENVLLRIYDDENMVVLLLTLGVPHYKITVQGPSRLTFYFDAKKSEPAEKLMLEQGPIPVDYHDVEKSQRTWKRALMQMRAKRRQ